MAWKITIDSVQHTPTVTSTINIRCTFFDDANPARSATRDYSIDAGSTRTNADLQAFLKAQLQAYIDVDTVKSQFDGIVGRTFTVGQL